MAGKSALPSLYSPDPDDQELINEIKGQYTELSEALKARKLPFDPKWMALAQGFLAPTQTGSFGESLGYAAKGYSDAALAEEKTAQERAALRLQLAQGELGQRQATRKAQKSQQILMGGFPQAGVTPSTEGTGSTTGGAPEAGKPPQGLRDITMTDVRAAMAVDQDLGKQVLDIYKTQGDDVKLAMNGTAYNVRTGKYVTGLQIPGQTPSSFVIPEVKGKLNMMPWQYEQYQDYRERGMGKEWVSNFMSPEPVPLKQIKKSETPVTMPSATGMVEESSDLTEAGLAASAESKKTTATERAKGENTRFQTIVNNAETAGNRQSMYNALGTIAKRPDANQILGVFEDNDLSSALFKLAETSGKGLPQVNEIRDIFTNFGLDKKLKADQLAAAQLIAQINLDLRKITRTPGEGAYSDLETNMMLAAGPSMKDTPLGLQKKLSLLNARAQFEKDVSRSLLDSNMDADKFKRSDVYDKMIDGYNQKLVNIMFPNQKVVVPTGKQPTVNDIKKSLEKKRGVN
jgi:hypothetical protein